MKKKYLAALILFVSYCYNYSAQPPTFRIVNDPSFLEDKKIITNPKDLLSVAKKTLLYLQKKSLEDPEINSKLFKNKNTYLKTTKNTLNCLIEHLQSSPHKMLSPDFLIKNFKFIRWSGDNVSASQRNINIPTKQHIRLTKYLVFKVQGSSHKTINHPYALYAIPSDEENLTEAEIEKNKNKLIRFKYTKQDILNGALETPENKDKVKPLVWLSREALEEAVMQGTTIVEMPTSQKQRMFNVAKNNAIPYDKKLKDKTLQKRYWYFREVHGFEGYGKDINSKISIQPEVTFAGDVSNLGLGSLIVIDYINPLTQEKEIRFGIVADKGGAFEKNLYQLDYFVGAFDNRDKFKKFISALPETCAAYILIAK